MSAIQQDIERADERTKENFEATATSCHQILESMGYIVLKPGSKAYNEYQQKELY